MRHGKKPTKIGISAIVLLAMLTFPGCNVNYTIITTPQTDKTEKTGADIKESWEEGRDADDPYFAEGEDLPYENSVYIKDLTPLYDAVPMVTLSVFHEDVNRFIEDNDITTITGFLEIKGVHSETDVTTFVLVPEEADKNVINVSVSKDNGSITYNYEDVSQTVVHDYEGEYSSNK